MGSKFLGEFMSAFSSPRFLHRRRIPAFIGTNVSFRYTSGIPATAKICPGPFCDVVVSTSKGRFDAR
jgi:hypothetical protein